MTLLRKMPKNLALFLAKNGQKSGSKFKKMAQKNLIGENGGKRNINPRANPEFCHLFYFSVAMVTKWQTK